MEQQLDWLRIDELNGLFSSSATKLCFVVGYRPEAHLPQGSLHSILLKKKNSISAPFAFQQTCPGEERVAESISLFINQTY